MEAGLKTGDSLGRLHASMRFRLLGLLPLAFFTLHALYYIRYGGVPHLMWMCNLGNVVLAAGLFIYSPMLIRVAVIWLIPGLPLWFYYVVLNGGWLLTSTFSHVGGVAVGLYALYRVRADKWSWVYAFIWYLLVQQVTRLITPPELNINVAHKVFDGWEGSFEGYFMFWLATTGIVLGGLLVLGLALYLLLPPRRGVTKEEPAQG